MLKILLFLIPVLVYGGGDPYNMGKKLYFSKGCNGCHGVSATGNGQYPSLAYRRKNILVNKLKRLRSKQGDTQLAQLMIPIAMTLNDTQIDALATFLNDYHENKKNSYVPDDSVTVGDGS